jgi:hypothetical protein
MLYVCRMKTINEKNYNSNDETRQGTLTEGEGSVRLISKLRQLVLYKRTDIFSEYKAVDINR